MYYKKLTILLLLIVFSNIFFGENNSDSILYKNAVKYYHSNPDSALFFVEQIISNNKKKSNYYTAKAFLLGGVLYKNIGKTDSAYTFYQKSEKIFSEIKDNIGLASVKNNLARLYHQSGKLDLALDEMLKSVFLFETEKDTANMAESYTNLGDLYLELKQNEKGLYFLNKARLLFKLNKNKIGEAFILTNIGLLKEDKNELDSAMFYYSQSLELLTNANRDKLYADCCVKIARVYLKKNNYNKSKFHYLLAEQKYKHIDYPLGIAKCKYGMGNFYLQKENYSLAIYNYKKSIEISKKLKATSLTKDILFNIYKTYKKKQNVNKALLYFEEYNRLKDTLIGVEAQTRIAKVQAGYDLILNQKKIEKLEDIAKIQKLKNEKITLNAEKQRIGIYFLIFGIFVFITISILLLKKYQTKNKLNRKLSISLSEREILLKELHHRVKNNLQIISSLLNLQKQYKENKSVDEILDVSRNRIATMVSVHEKLYKTKSFKEVDIKKYTEELISNVASSFNSQKINIKFEVVSEDININVNTLIPCGLILNELITNSFKYAFTNTENGFFSVNIHKKNETIIIDVKDNGKGLPSNFDYSNSNTLGMKLIKGLTEQINGTFEILTPEIGTHFRFSFNE